MIRMLRKWFIKDYEDVRNNKVRIAHGVFASTISIILNAILIGLKLTSALLLASKQNWVLSMALIGDSINNTGDLASSLIALIGFNSAKKPPDAEHPFGHQRMEYIASLMIGMVIIFASIVLLKQSITNLVEQQIVNYDTFAYIVFGASILIKSLQTYLCYSLGKAIDSLTLKGVGLDSLLDIISSTILLAGTLLSTLLGVPYLDGILGIAIAIFIFASALKMVLEAISQLLGERIDKEEEQEILEALFNYPGILGVHDLLVHEYGKGASYISAHIEVDATLSLLEAHDIADGAEKLIHEKFEKEIILHVDPRRMDEESLQIEAKLKGILEELIPNASLHDLQINNDIIRFDILAPFSKSQLDLGVICDSFAKKLPQYHFDIHLDHPYD